MRKNAWIPFVPITFVLILFLVLASWFFGWYKIFRGLPVCLGSCSSQYLKYKNENYYGERSVIDFKEEDSFTDVVGYTFTEYLTVIEVKGREQDKDKDFLQVRGFTYVKGSTLEKFYNTPVDEISYSYYNEKFYIQTQESLCVNDLISYNVEKGSDLYEDLRRYRAKSHILSIAIPSEYDYVEKIKIWFNCSFKDGVYYIEIIDTKSKLDDYDDYKISAVKEEYYYLFETVPFS